ncbi:MAG: DUF4468 domain-containing protein [Bacteroidota bacterium]
MKRFYLFILMSLLFHFAQAQKNFKWERVDSTGKKLGELYTDTKKFIADTWGTSDKIIQKDDKEAGVIAVNYSIVRKLNYLTDEYVYSYQYTVTFKLKDNQFKCTLDHVFCEFAYITNGKTPIVKIEPFDEDKCPETGTAKSPGLPKVKAIQMMKFIKQELQGVVDSYGQSINKKIDDKPVKKKRYADEEE